jgi:hypothetical protein
MTPSEVTQQNQQIVWENIYGGDVFKLTKPCNKFTYKVGDLVRMSHTRDVFSRGYNQGWSNEIFTIKERFNSNPPTYSLEDFAGDSIAGKVYEPEITKIIQKEANPLYKVEKILEKRRTRKGVEYFVKWSGWDKKFNSWVSSDQVVNLLEVDDE